MAEAILIDRVSNAANWMEVCTDLRQEAEIRQMPVTELVKEVLRKDYDDAIDVDLIDWSILLEGGDPAIDEVGVDSSDAE